MNRRPLLRPVPPEERGWGHTKLVPEAPERPRAHSTRNTRKWCRGKEGVEHKWKWVPHPRYRWPDGRPWGWMVEQCEACLKERRYCTGGGLMRERTCICGKH